MLFGISTFDRRDFLRSAAIALAATVSKQPILGLVMLGSILPANSVIGLRLRFRLCVGRCLALVV